MELLGKTSFEGEDPLHDPSSCSVVAFLSSKGGAGKTTISINLAWEMAGRGYRTLLIDADVGTGGASALLCDHIQQEVQQILSPECCFSDCISHNIKLPTPLRIGYSKSETAYNPATLASDIELAAQARKRGILDSFSFDLLLSGYETWLDPYADDSKIPAGFDLTDPNHRYREDEVLKRVRSVLSTLCGHYEIIIVDTRGGGDTTAFFLSQLAKTWYLISEPDAPSQRRTRDLDRAYRYHAEKMKSPIARGQSYRAPALILNKYWQGQSQKLTIFADLDVAQTFPLEAEVIRAYTVSGLILMRNPVCDFSSELFSLANRLWGHKSPSLSRTGDALRLHHERLLKDQRWFSATNLPRILRACTTGVGVIAWVGVLNFSFVYGFWLQVIVLSSIFLFYSFYKIFWFPGSKDQPKPKYKLPNLVTFFRQVPLLIALVGPLILGVKGALLTVPKAQLAALELSNTLLTERNQERNTEVGELEIKLKDSTSRAEKAETDHKAAANQLTEKSQLIENVKLALSVPTNSSDVEIIDSARRILAAANMTDLQIVNFVERRKLWLNELSDLNGSLSHLQDDEAEQAQLLLVYLDNWSDLSVKLRDADMKRWKPWKFAIQSDEQLMTLFFNSFAKNINVREWGVFNVPQALALVQMVSAISPGAAIKVTEQKLKPLFEQGKILKDTSTLAYLWAACYITLSEYAAPEKISAADEKARSQWKQRMELFINGLIDLGIPEWSKIDLALRSGAGNNIVSWPSDWMDLESKFVRLLPKCSDKLKSARPPEPKP